MLIPKVPSILVTVISLHYKSKKQSVNISHCRNYWQSGIWFI